MGSEFLPTPLGSIGAGGRLEPPVVESVGADWGTEFVVPLMLPGSPLSLRLQAVSVSVKTLKQSRTLEVFRSRFITIPFKKRGRRRLLT